MNLENLLKKDITQQEFLNYLNACITYVTLPEGINGCVFEYKNIYNIFINTELSYYKKKKTIIHELAHIELSQFNQVNKDLFAFHTKNYEDEADEYIKNILNKIIYSSL